MKNKRTVNILTLARAPLAILSDKERYMVLKDLLIAEDRVFGDRMSLFLIVNSILLVGFSQLKLQIPVITLIGMVLDLIWFYVGWMSYKAHLFWSDEMVVLEERAEGTMMANLQGIIGKRRDRYPKVMPLKKWHIMSSTAILSKALPILFFVMWTYLLLMG